MGPRDFDAVALGNAETDVWAAYYRHEWRTLLASAVKMVRLGFGMGWVRTVRGAWWVLRANQAWAPYPDNNPDRAREFMRRFYELVARDGGLSLDPVEASGREVEWWRVHRLHQREDAVTEADLVQALVDLYSYVYRVSPQTVTSAAAHRVSAMAHSDAWVEGGCSRYDPQLAAERLELVASYSALLTAVQLPAA